MATEVILPRVDMDMATGQISRWYVEPGNKVEKGQALFEIETDKAAMEIEAPASGVLVEPAGTGVDIAVGTAVGWIAAEGEDVAGLGAKAAPEPALAEVAAAPAVKPDSRTDVVEAAVAEAVRTAAPAAPAAAPGLRATPLARRLARDRGVDLAGIGGSGPHGRIQARDVEAAGRAVSAPAPAPSAPAPVRPQPAPAAFAAAPVAEAPPPPRPAPVRPAAAGPLNTAWLRQGDGEPIVLVHGFGADLDSWRPFVQGLGAGRPVFAVDLPGHGLSPAGGQLDLDDLADQVAAAVAAACPGPVHLVGHSLGAAVATLVADSGLVTARSLFLIAPAGLGPEVDGAFIAGFGRARTEAALGPWMRRLVHDPAVVTDALVRATARARARTESADGHEAVAAAVFPEGTQAGTILAAIGRLGIPVRAVFGREDAVLPAVQASRLPGHVAVHRLAGTGHMPHLEERDLVLRLLDQHIRSA